MSRVHAIGLMLLSAAVCLEAGQAPAAGQATKTAWTMEQLLPAVAEIKSGRDWKQGGQTFQQAGCGICHSFSTYWQGNGLAPDLTAVGSKFTRDIILRSILEPSAEINPQYMHTEFSLKDGGVIRGTLIEIVDRKFIVAPVMMSPDVTIEIPQADVKSDAPSAVSPMPAGLVDGFSREQVLDLFAFLLAGGNQDAAVFGRP
jgi:putative heme-binding domain-containing protein